MRKYGLYHVQEMENTHETIDKLKMVVVKTVQYFVGRNSMVPSVCGEDI